jgi:hypothetical protein
MLLPIEQGDRRVDNPSWRGANAIRTQLSFASEVDDEATAHHQEVDDEATAHHQESLLNGPNSIGIECLTLATANAR